MDRTRKHSNIIQWVYVGLVILAGLPLIIIAIQKYVELIQNSTLLQLKKELVDVVVLIIMSTLCRSMPIYFRKDQALDVSVITIFASVLVKGPWTTILIITVSSLFYIEPEKGAGRVKHIFNIPIYKTLFNNSNYIISCFVGSMVYLALGGVPGDLTLPGVLLPAIGFILPAFIMSSIMLGILMMLMHPIRFTDILKNTIVSMLPNLIGTAPVGFFLAWFFTMPSGPYLSLLFLLPLLLARYAFKLYLDSKSQFYKTIKTLTAAIEAKDKYTQGHSKRVEMYAERIARAMNLSSGSIEEIKVAALLHDIGKIGIDDGILRKPGHLSKSEWSLIREHPSIGLYILEDVEMPKVIKDNILYHHVYYNGGGYPEVADYRSQVPIGAYIIAVADAYDAMTSNRPYREAMHSEQAMSILKENSGVQFHPEVVEAFERVMHS